jgi:acyl-CoA thioesterase
MPDPSAMEVARTMFARDAASNMLGMRIEACQVGTATVTMTVRADMVNGLKLCHGGLIFTLADSAFAFACNSANHNTVAAGCSIEFLAPATLGDTLTATATERALRGKQGIYDIDVHNQTGTLIAVFRGKSARIPGQTIPTEASVSAR